MRALPDIRQIDVAGRRVLVRADLNAPLRDGKVADTTRIDRFAPTVRDLLERGAHVVVMTHLGRPGGEPNPVYSVRPVADALARAAGCEVAFVSDCVGTAAEKSLTESAPGRVVLLENLRFHKGEEANSRTFALRLSVHGDIYVNDAFSCAHRAHASTHAIAEAMPAYAGPSLIAEVDALNSVLDRPNRPVAAIVGGAKISSKIDILRQLAARMDHLIIGGGMANTFLAAQGHSVGSSLCEHDSFDTAREVMDVARKSSCNIVLPQDVVVAGAFSAEVPCSVVAADAIPSNRMALDIGPASVHHISLLLSRCRTLLWNGPLGAFELPPFAHGTFHVAHHAAQLTRSGKLTTIAGGGDTAAALASAGVADRFTYLSTAGGAFLEWLEGRALPGIEILRTVKTKLEIA